MLLISLYSGDGDGDGAGDGPMVVTVTKITGDRLSFFDWRVRSGGNKDGKGNEK